MIVKLLATGLGAAVPMGTHAPGEANITGNASRALPHLPLHLHLWLPQHLHHHHHLLLPLHQVTLLFLPSLQHAKQHRHEPCADCVAVLLLLLAKLSQDCHFLCLSFLFFGSLIVTVTVVIQLQYAECLSPSCRVLPTWCVIVYDDCVHVVMPAQTYCDVLRIAFFNSSL